jgi:hypothetical protein
MLFTWARLPPQRLPIGRISASAPMSSGRWGWGLTGAERIISSVVLCASCSVRGMGAQSQHPLSSRKGRYGGSRRRRADVFGSAHGRRMFSNRLLWITDASRLPEPVRCQSLGLRQTINGIDNSGLCQFWLLVPFAPFRTRKRLHRQLLLLGR